MRATMTEPRRARGRVEHRDLPKRLGAVAWGLFFVWAGIAFLAQVGWGIALVGVGVITLGMQLVRKVLGLQLEAFWMIMGVLFFVAGLWEMLTVSVPFLPLLFLAIGAALLWLAIGRGKT